MTWLVFGVSCLLVLAGAVSIISGAPIIQIERGWTEVIAGTVALSSGGIVFALAAILVRLESLRDALAMPRTAAEVLLTEEPTTLPMVEATTSVATMIPAQAPEEIPAATKDTSPETDANETGQGLWKRVKRPGETILDAGAPDRGVAPERERLAEIATPMPHAEPASASTTPLVAIDRASETDNTATTEPSQLGWLERSLFKGRLPKPIPDDRPPVLPRAEPMNPPPFGGPLAEPRIEPHVVPDPGHDNLPPTGISGERAEIEAGVTVIGRYQAGVASYVMYSDGTIEVETEGGQSHRFASMEELKAFIGNQDNVLS